MIYIYTLCDISNKMKQGGGGKVCTMRRLSASCLTVTNGKTTVYGCVEAPFIFTIVVKIRWGKLLQAVMCRLLIDKTTQLII